MLGCVAELIYSTLTYGDDHGCIESAEATSSVDLDAIVVKPKDAAQSHAQPHPISEPDSCLPESSTLTESLNAAAREIESLRRCVDLSLMSDTEPLSTHIRMTREP